jgi:MFS family permease
MFAIGIYLPFMNGANNLFVKRFCYNPVGAGKALVVTYVVAVVFSPLLGLLIDKVGHKRYFIMLCMLVFTVGELIILLYPQCQIGDPHENGAIAGLVFIGIGYCLYGNSIIPAVSLVVKKRITGTAFGLMQTMESLSLTFFPLINGSLIEHGSKDPNNPTGYRHSSLFFVMIGLLGMLTSVGLLFIPDKFKRKLDRVSKDKMEVKHGENG